MELSRDDFIIAIRSAFLKKGTQQRFSLLSLIFFSIVFLILGSLNFKAVDYVKKGIKEIVYRSSFIVSGPENFVKNNYLIASNHFKLYEENKKIITELNYLRGKDLFQKITILENTKYKKLIDDYFIEDKETVAKVLIDKQSPFLRSVVINKGSKNNIKLGMAVLDGIHLVGKVVEVNYLTSRVLLLSDINAKIPVSLEPGDIQAIMSGTGNQNGILQYTKNDNLEKKTGEKLVYTSGAGGLFKSGIPIGKINEEKILANNEKIVDFYIDFSQLKYVKVISFSKEKSFIEESVEEEIKSLNIQIAEMKMAKETIKVLLEEKKITKETRIKIEAENIFLKNKIINLQNTALIAKKIIKKNETRRKELEFLELNILHGRKCKKTIFNKLYTVGSQEYKACILSKGLKKN